MKQISVAKTAGFCFGVARAVDMVYQLAAQKDNIKTLGPIIHNPQIVEDLSAQGVSIIEHPQDAQAGDTVVIRSHGVSPAVIRQLDQSKVSYVNATCPFVKKIHQIVQEKSGEGYTVIIAGNKNHPEVLGIQGYCQTLCYIVKDEKEIEKLQILPDDKLVLVAQTTFQMNSWKKCVETLKKLYTNAIFFDTICSATKHRQQEAAELAKQNDLMIVIGGKQSSNTEKLKEVCQKHTETRLIETVEELSDISLRNYERVGVTAGASTPAYIIKEVLTNMSEELKKQGEEMDFATLLEQSLETEKLYNGKRVRGLVTTIAPNEIHVDIGAKQAGIIPFHELTDEPGASVDDIVQKGDEIDLIVLSINDQEGIVMLSKKRCDAMAGFDKIKEAYEQDAALTGVITNVVKGGVLALSNHTKIFIPASQVSNRRVEDLSSLLKTEVSFKILEINERKGRALGSVRAVLNEAKKEQEEAFWAEIEEGKSYTGEVKSLTSYGAFVNLGGVDGMIHITELSWSKPKHPSEVVSVGDVVDVYVKELDREKRRISLGYKKSEENPWGIFNQKYHIGDIVTAKIVSFTNYGAFATIMPLIDGLIHISQIANQRVEKISDLLEIGQEVEVKIIDINMENRRVSLSMRALLPEHDHKIVRDDNDTDVVYSSEEGILSEDLQDELTPVMDEQIEESTI